MIRNRIKEHRARRDMTQEELARLVEAYNGQKPDLVGKMGVCVAINAGPRIVGISFRGKEADHACGEVR